MTLRKMPRVAALVVALLVVDVAWNLSLNTVLTRSGLAATGQLTYDAVLPLSGTGAAAGFAAATVAAVALFTALVRTFAADTLGAGSPVETALVYGRALVVAVGGAVAVLLGLVLLVVPGLLAALHLPLVFVAVAADGESVGQAVVRARGRARGNRARIVAVVLAVVVVPLAVAVVATLTALLSPAVELAVGVVVTTAAATAGLAAFTGIATSLDDGTARSSSTDRVAPATSRQL